MIKLFSLFVLISACVAIESPSYTVLSSIGDNIEIRRYPPTKWITTTDFGLYKDYKASKNSVMFYKLLNFINGQNSQNLKIPMTAPVTTIFKNSDNGLVNMDSNVAIVKRFYLPKDSPITAIREAESDVFIQEEQEVTFACISFKGLALMDTYLSHRDMLIRALGSDSESYDLVNIVIAGYDNPRTPEQDKRNEVWLRKLN